MANAASFFDKNWTLLNKINGIADWLKENNIDLTNWNLKFFWISGVSYNKFDVICEAYYDSISQINFRNVYICINDVAGSTVSPRLDTVNWKHLLAIPVPEETKVYCHTINIKRGSTMETKFTYYSTDATPFTYASFCSQFPSSAPCSILNGFVFTSSTYYACVIDAGEIVGVGIRVNYFTSSMLAMVVFNASDTFTDTVVEV